MIKFFKKGGKTLEISNKKLISLIRVALFFLLVIMLLTVLLQSLENYIIITSLSLLLLVSFFVKVFLQISLNQKIPFVVLDCAALFALSYFAGTALSSLLFIIVIAEFYLNNEFLANLIVGLINFLCYLFSILFAKEVSLLDIKVTDLYALMIKDGLVFLFVFLILNMTMTILRRNYIIEKNLELVRRREKKLKEAYDKLEEVTILEERNRIAKEIHDTTGHSITTVIMQTEAAKMIIDKKPKEAKEKIILANMQAVNALEELRQSVKILSGSDTEFNLSEHIEKTIKETMAGTNIVIRSQIDDISVDEKIAKFLYFTFKEGLNNGIRHGKSTAFYLKITEKNNAVNFLLSDNGRGISLNKLDFGYGLTSMREKAKHLGGEIYFISDLGEGFEINITFNKKEVEND